MQQLEQAEWPVERAATPTPDLSVVVPCFNEEANLPLLTDRLFAATEEAGIDCEIVFVDDGSTDTTPDVIAELAHRNPSRVAGVAHDRNRGIAAAWTTGLAAARGRYACFLDADLQHPPEEVPTLYQRLLESRADLVQGTRSSIERIRDSRLVASRGLNLLLNLGFGGDATDSKSGFVLAPRRVLADVIAHERPYRFFQTFITVAARSKGYTVLEVETLFQSRNAGQSFLSGKTIWVSLSALLDFPLAWRDYGWRRTHPLGSSVAPKVAPAAAGAAVAVPEPTTTREHPYRGWRRLLFETYFATTPLHKWLIGRRTRSLYLELKETEWRTREEIETLQLTKLQRLLQHAYVHVPYYRTAMDEIGLHPEEVESLDDLRRLPLLSKDDVRKNLYFKLFSDQHRKREMHRISTSGSTGEPFLTYADKYQLEVRFATTLRALEWTGWRLGDKQARLWHQTIGMTGLQVVRERIDALLMRRMFVPAFEFSHETLERYMAKLRRYKPVLLDGYAESLNFLATYAGQGGTIGFRPRAIMSSAQSLPESARRTIEEAFDARVYDKYGSREFSGIAYQCSESDDHHVMDESYIVELLVDGRPARPGETGEVVITDLNNFSVPLIRYRLGDLAVAVEQSGPCACGRHLSRIGQIEGRTQAIVHCADGTWLPGAFFLHLLKEYEYAIRFFQIHQSEPGAFTLRVVKNRQFTDRALVEVLAELHRYAGAETSIDVEFVDEIPLLSTGKRTPVVSELRMDFQSLGSRGSSTR